MPGAYIPVQVTVIKWVIPNSAEVQLIFLKESNKKPPFDFEDFSLSSHCDFVKVYKSYQEITFWL